ncbi:hypothetical protein MY11210_004428 [Beauveria gryllotalpidicola]
MSTLFDSDILQKLVSPEAQHLHRLLKELSRIGVGSIDTYKWDTRAMNAGSSGAA